MAKKTSTADLMLKWKRKKWFPVKCSEVFGEQVVGEVLGEEVQNTIGKVIDLNLMSLTNDPRKQIYNVVFKIVRNEGNTSIAQVVGIRMLNAMVKKMVRKRKSKIDDSFILKTSDGKYVVFKTLIITQNLVSNSVATKLRKQARYLMTKYSETHTYVELVNDVLNEKVANDLKQKANKISAINTYKVRMFKLIEVPTNRQILLHNKFVEEVKNYNLEDLKLTEASKENTQ